jgi:GH15 family glucan-1,4-alpha-glucosidase
LLRAAMGSPEQVQIMYGLSGERMLNERDIPWLPGYEKSAPVRIGNAAHAQMQIDVYGEVMETMLQASIAGLAASDDAWALQRRFTNHVIKIWHEPDSGIWEVRGPRQHFTHSKVMAWVAVDRAIKSVELFGLDGPVDEWRVVRDQIHAEVCERAWNAKLGCFVQAYDSDLPDASTLIMVAVGFLPPDDERMIATVKCVEENLFEDPLVLRYDSGETQDGLPEGEGAFLACSFWLADCYTLMGRRDDAVRLFEHMLTLCNDVGLLSEEYDSILKRQCGNFPQGFSHLALLITAFNLSKHAEQAPLTQRAAS